MRGSGHSMGIFDPHFEMRDINAGISFDLTSFVGATVLWYVWSSAPHVDPIYDVGEDDGFGRTWASPLTITVTRPVLKRGSGMDSGLGYYIVDSLHLTVNATDIAPIIPNVIPVPDTHTKDRVVYEGQVYRPVNVQPRGIIGSKYALLTVDLTQVAKEEMVNDAQFQFYAQ